MIKKSIHQEVTAVNTYAPDNEAHKNIKQSLTKRKREVDGCITGAGDFKASLSTTKRSSRQKINKRTADFNNAIYQTHPADTRSTDLPLHILLQCTWNTLQGRSDVRLQNKS